jgi:hypothetical protein
LKTSAAPATSTASAATMRVHIGTSYIITSQSPMLSYRTQQNCQQASATLANTQLVVLASLTSTLWAARTTSDHLATANTYMHA